jgi:uncharacterized RDD family membrane protein YckC
VTVAAAAGTPGIARRLACMLYEVILLFAVGFAATSLFFYASGGLGASGHGRTLLQLFLLTVFAGYFLWCWLRGGQTLAMKTWKIRLVAPGHDRVPPLTALLRFALAVVAVPTGIALVWAIFDRDRQFLHDRIVGTRLVTA